MASPDRLPEDVFEVNGFRRVRGGEFFVEWRDVSPNYVNKVWIMYETTPSYANGWEVGFEMKNRSTGRFEESGMISEHMAEDFDGALQSAMDYMRRVGSGGEDMSGSVPSDFDFGGLG